MTTYPNCPPDCQERTDCPEAGTPGHWFCGWCDEHQTPRHHCHHSYKEVE